MKATLIDHMGDDLSVVNAARVSFGKKSEYSNQPEYLWGEPPKLKEGDKRLIQFLARGCTSGDWDQLLIDVGDAGLSWLYWMDNNAENELKELVKYIKRMPDHWTPFGHTAITVHVKAPLFVARQLGKHQVGFVWNEVSRRYVTDEPEFYTPKVWRKAADNVKQGSSGEEVDTKVYYGTEGKHGVGNPYEESVDISMETYTYLLSKGVCPEQARMVLPQSMYTEWYWTGNLYSFANMYIQRTDSHTQKETQEIAQQIGELIAPLFPVSWEALTQ